MRALLTALAVLAAEPSIAREWKVDSAASTIRFVYAVDDGAAEGAFEQLEGEGMFDPDRPEDTTLELRILTRSLDLGNPMETGFALSAEWFDAGNFPVARYRLARLTPMPDGRWEALGDLTIKGRKQVLRTPIALDIDDDRARARGEVVFDRTDFGVGVGVSALFVTIGAEVSVAFDLVARPAGRALE